LVKIRETASVHLDAPREQVVELLQDPDTLSLVTPEGTTMTRVGEDEVHLTGKLEGVDVDERCRVSVEDERRVELEPILTKGGSTGSWFVADEEGEGTRLVHGMWVEPGNLLEEIKARLRWRDFEGDLEEDLEKVKSLLQAVDSTEV
jgi:carbon monoxide dehydrogenase subunit G